MSTKYRRLSAVVLVLLPLLIPIAASANGSNPLDVRILIDVSGSMKQNDPQNLRRSALRLLVGLLPENTRAGVWTFGRYVNMQIPLGEVDEQWKASARKKADEIHSLGLYTNIEDALKRATEDWTREDPDRERHVVLLTDGMVDVSKDPNADEASRGQILNSIMPELAAQSASIHTIALSERADGELMRSLANDTGGWNEQVNDADQLQRVFLRIFEKVGKPDTLPLSDNRFSVDGSVKEVTLLVFRKQDAEATRLVSPSGAEISAESKPESVSWHSDVGYDLITLQQPAEGEWQILAEADPDNRAMIVTDLKMLSTDLPNRLILGQPIALKVRFTDEGKTIERNDFLDLIKVHAKGPGDDFLPLAEPLEFSRQADDAKGVFSLEWQPEADGNAGELVIKANGATFARERRQAFEAVAPATVKLLGSAEEGGMLTMELEAAEGLINPASVEVEAGVFSDGQLQSSLDIQYVSSRRHWAGSIDPATLPFDNELRITLKAETVEGAAIVYTPDPLPIRGTQAAAVVEPEPAPEPVAVEEPAAESAPDDEPVADDAVDWITSALIFAAANGILILVGGAGFWFWRRRSKADKELTLFDEGAAAV